MLEGESLRQPQTFVVAQPSNFSIGNPQVRVKPIVRKKLAVATGPIGH